MSQVKEYLSLFLSFLAGETCLSCNNAFGFICSDCIKKLPFNNGYKCSICALPMDGVSGAILCGNCMRKKTYFSKIYSPFIYEGVIKTAIQHAKFHQCSFYFKKLFKLAEKDIKKELQDLTNFDAIIPVPISKKRLMERGFNQSLIISGMLSKLTKIPVLNDILIKERDTMPQTSFGREDRFKNVKNVFSLKKRLNSVKVILVDDIVTTTATVKEASNTLKKGGVKDVIVFSLARAKD